MAQYFTDDFADWSTDWTDRWHTGAAWSTALSGGVVTYPAGFTNDWIGWTWNDIDSDANRANVEVVACYTPSSNTNVDRLLAVRGAGADETNVAYNVATSVNGATSWIRAYQQNGADSGTNFAQSANKTLTIGATTYVRMRVNGTGPTTYKARIWQGGVGSEPGTWDIDTTDTGGPTAAGWVGLSQYSTPSPRVALDWIGVGTNGDAAPTSAVASYVRPLVLVRNNALVRASRW